MVWMIPAAMAAASMLMQNDQNHRAKRMNSANAKAAAVQTQFSPWTKLGAGDYQHQEQKSEMGAGMQGAMAGMSMQQQFGQAGQQKQLADSQVGMNNAQADYYRTQQKPPQQPYSSAMNYRPQFNPYG